MINVQCTGVPCVYIFTESFYLVSASHEDDRRQSLMIDRQIIPDNEYK